MSNKEKVYAIKSYPLLKAARKIFGSSKIKGAWKLSTYSLNAKDYFYDKAKTPFSSDYFSDGDINIGCVDILLLFDNGKYVQIGASEWGSISAFKDEMVEIE